MFFCAKDDSDKVAYTCLFNIDRFVLDNLSTFEIPEPIVTSPGVDDGECLSLRDDLKRFRNEYSKPVQFRCVGLSMFHSSNYMCVMSLHDEFLIESNM